MTAKNLTVEEIEARQRARAEILEYRDRNRLERQAKAVRDETAEAEIARTINQRREDEANQQLIASDLARFWAERELRLEVERKNFKPATVIAESAPTRLAKRIRTLLGNDFESVLEDMKLVNFRDLRHELMLIPGNERAEEIHRQRVEAAAKQAAESMIVPEPENAHEQLIIAKHGLAGSVAHRRAELDAGAL